MSDTGRLYGAAAVSYHLLTGGAPSLRGIELAVDGGLVGAGGSGSRYITADDGSRWVMKSHILGGQSHRYLCLNEAVSAQLAHRVGASVPEAAVVELTVDQLDGLCPGAKEGDRYCFASEFIRDAEALSPSSAANADPSELAAFTVLDAVVNNTDRKPEHVLAWLQHDGAWKTWAIDHGHTLAVSDTLSSFSATSPALPPIPLVAEHLQPDEVARWVDAFRALDRQEVVAMVEGLPANWVIEPEASATLADALMERIERLPELLKPHFTV